MPAPEIELYATRSGTTDLVAAPILFATNNQNATNRIQIRLSATCLFQNSNASHSYASLRFSLGLV